MLDEHSVAMLWRFAIDLRLCLLANSAISDSLSHACNERSQETRVRKLIKQVKTTETAQSGETCQSSVNMLIRK